MFKRLRRRHRTNYHPVVLITGCGSGIGWALMKLLFQKTNYRIVATARESSIQVIKDKFPESERFRALVLDVTNEASRESVIAQVAKIWGSVDILVNNAGISYRSVVEHMTERDELLQMRTNYLGPIGLIRLVLPGMRMQGRGKIINVSSVSGMLAMPTMASYSASKYALEGASESLWYEVRPLGINVSLIQPGFVRSNSFRNVYYSEKSNPTVCFEEAYSDYYSNMNPFIEKMMNRSLTTPDQVAKTILGVIQQESPPLWIPATFDAILFYYIRRILPRRILLPVLFWALPGARNWGKAYTHKRT
jgi:NADP-dependent 3-hydroxy acid dehydrogenase YdfG